MSGKKRSNSAPQYDIEYLKAAGDSAGWPRIISTLAGVDIDCLDGRHHPCPKCGGTDRFRLLEDKGTGGIICNHCQRTGCGDGLATIGWLTGWNFGQVLKRVAEYLGIAPSERGESRKSGKKNQPKQDPSANLEWMPWSPGIAAIFCGGKPPITPESLLAIGAKMARYRRQYTVIAVPVWDERAIKQGVIDGAIVGWSLWNAGGGLLPIYSKDGGSVAVEWSKVKLTAGTQSGLIGDPARIRAAKTLIKLEGPSDVAAAHSLADLPADAAPLSNAHGAGERPKEWMVDLFADRAALICHDADKPGQDGAIGEVDARTKKLRPGWLQMIATKSPAVENLALPYPIEPNHGKDARDFFAGGATWADLLALPRRTPAPEDPPGVVAPVVVAGDGAKPVEADDDPHRLGRVNLARYAERTDGGKIVYWRDRWYTWKPERGCYQVIGDRELAARVTQSVRLEYERLNLADVEDWKKNPNGPDGEPRDPPKIHRVTRRLIADTVAAMASDVQLRGTVEPNSWIDPPTNPLSSPTDRPSIIALKNGLLDIGSLVAGVPAADCLEPLTPNWFSFVRLPYAFDPQAQCPEWERFLETVMEGDSDRINRLQEWAGYLLTADSRHQKFLALEGEGRNGKSVYLAGITAMLGAENVSNVKLEDLAERFQAASTIGKLANICADTNEIDVRSEGFLKAYVSGDRIHCDLKGREGMDFVPSARLVLAWNNRPRFSDKSDGTWRRMLMVVWRYQVPPEKVVLGMDTVGYWESSGELPGILNWALRGLIRLRENLKFTPSQICDEVIEEFRDEANPARVFIRDYTAEKTDGRVSCSLVFSLYQNWAKLQGFRFPIHSEVFGREVFRFWKEKVRRARNRDSETGRRGYYYLGIDLKNVEKSELGNEDDPLKNF